MCKSWCEIVLGVIILISALWPAPFSKWVLLIVALILILHSFMCKQCFVKQEMPVKSTKKRK